MFNFTFYIAVSMGVLFAVTAPWVLMVATIIFITRPGYAREHIYVVKDRVLQAMASICLLLLGLCAGSSLAIFEETRPVSGVVCFVTLYLAYTLMTLIVGAKLYFKDDTVCTKRC